MVEGRRRIWSGWTREKFTTAYDSLTNTKENFTLQISCRVLYCNCLYIMSGGEIFS
jgi:hypothetical protein